MDWISDPTAWSALAALLTLEIVLGVDNVVFISILASKLPPEEQDKARKIGLLAAGGMRVVLLLAVGWVVTLKKELFAIGSVGFSGKELILLAGGLFLIYKATKEIHHKLEGEEGTTSAKVAPTIVAVIGQVLLLDIVFSIDSVITAVGMTSYVGVMVIAIMAAVFVMLLASKAIYTFVNAHPSVKMLALAFLLSPLPWVHLLLAEVQAPRAWLVLSPRCPVQAVLQEQLLSQGPAHFARERR